MEVQKISSVLRPIPSRSILSQNSETIYLSLEEWLINTFLLIYLRVYGYEYNISKVWRLVRKSPNKYAFIQPLLKLTIELNREPTEKELSDKLKIPEEKLPSDEIEVGTTGHFELNMTPLISTMVGSVRKPLESGMIFQFTDGAGNVSYVDTWDFKIDNEMDKPIAEIHVPSENEIITTDFEISGVVYDDDGLAKVC